MNRLRVCIPPDDFSKHMAKAMREVSGLASSDWQTLGPTGALAFVAWEKMEVVVGRSKRTTPGIPTWSPTVVLTRPEHA